MYKLLAEDNKQILEMIKQLDEKIIKLKQENKIPIEYLQPIVEFYQEATLPWLHRYDLLNREIDPESEKVVVDKIYNMFLLLKALED